ncbi:hypothetical protein [Lagierella sp.]|uniref:hypothetical protein n=1 Tax=Lagierella sp. TaxID=2849657 RepID=UPI002638B67B|nr:hypothetical protein [Lagierella sp.]
MKTFGKFILLSFAIAMAVSTTSYASVVTSEKRLNSLRTAYLEADENSQERYVLSKAINDNMSYAEAKRIVEKEEYDILNSNSENHKLLRSPNYYISYKTYSRTATTFNSVKVGKITIQFTVEVRVIHDRNDLSYTKIDSIGAPVATGSRYLIRFEHGGFNKYLLGDRSFRLSATGYFVMDASVGVGGPFFSVGTSGQIRSKTMTLSTTFNI